MEYITAFLNNSLASFLLTALISPLIIWLLYKGGVVVKHVLMKNKMNEEFVKLHKHKSGTPSMGGLIIAIPFLILGLLLVPSSELRNIFLIGFSIFALYGFIEEGIVKLNKFDNNFRLFQESFIWRVGKLVILFLIGFLMVNLMQQKLGIYQITIFGDLVVPFSGLFLVVWGFFMIIGVMGAEITDGLDGLVTGLFMIAYMFYLVICFLTGNVEFLPIIGLIVGSALVYLYFNITPARVFMGGVGAMPLGFGLVYLAYVTNTLVPFLILTAIFWVEIASSGIQILSIRFFNKKVFKIAPIHHHFEAIGWSEGKVVQRFWLAGLLLALISVWVLVKLATM